MSLILRISIIISFVVCNQYYSQNNNPYFIGHSLVGHTMPDMLDHLATTQQINYSSKRQIINGAPLKYNWENPELGEIGNYETDLSTGNYNSLIITEAIPLDNHIMWSDTHIMANNFYNYFSNYVSNGTSFIYETWHCINSGTPVDCDFDNGDAVLWRKRLDIDLSKWEAIADAINNQNPGANTKLIPAGQAMALLYDEIALNNLTGITSISDFFSDDIHLNDMGNYYIACVMYTVLFNETPIGLTRDINDTSGVPYQTPNTDLANQLQQLALTSVCNYQNASSGICQTLGTSQKYLNTSVEIIYSDETIKITANRSTVSELEIHNMYGQKVKHKTNVNKNTLRIKKPIVTQGLYILTVQLENGKKVSKKIVL